MTDFSTPRYVADFLLPHLVHTVSFTALLSSHPEEESAERSPHLFLSSLYSTQASSHGALRRKEVQHDPGRHFRNPDETATVTAGHARTCRNAKTAKKKPYGIKLVPAHKAHFLPFAQVFCCLCFYRKTKKGPTDCISAIS